MISEDAGKLTDSTTYVFGEFELETENLLLLRKHEVVPLAPKAVEVLLALIEANGKLITKAQILDKVWADTFVEEANLTHHISALRKVIGEDKNGRKFIETIPRRGYRFVSDVKKLTNSETAEIVLSERTAVHSVEETIIETDKPETARQTLLPAGNNSRKIGLFLAAVIIILLIGAGGFWAYQKVYLSKTSAAPTEITFKRLTPDMDVSAPSISPDGASVVFVKTENGQRSLWREQIASGELTQLTATVSAFDLTFPSIRFSPDGRWIYYTQNLFSQVEKTLTIYRIPAAGGAAQKILTGLDLNSDFSVSPDGKKIAYNYDWRQVIVADIETGEKKVVAERDGAKRVVFARNAPAWSPDGSSLIFSGAKIEDNRYVQELSEASLTTGVERPIPINENFPVDQIEWLADDRGLIVTAQGKIWRLDYRTGEKQRLSNETDIFSSIRTSADSKTIIAQQEFGQYNIWTAPADNIDKRRQITVGGAATHGLDGLAIAPSGKILYTSIESGTSDIWIMNADGSGRRQLTVNAGGYNGGMWVTSDERYIVFMSTRSGTNQVWRMDFDGSNPVQLSRGAENYSFSLSPENDVYYQTFSAAEQKYQIYKVPVAGGEPVKIDDYKSGGWQLQFSPDGKWILFFGGETRNDKPRTAIIDRKSGKIVRYFDNNFAPRGWMPDSKAIVDSMSQTQQLWRQPIDGSAAEKIYDLSPLKIARWDFSADGKQIVISLGNSTSEVVIIQNFSENLK